MNEKILKGQEMVRCENGIETVISTIMEKALTTRPKEKVYYRPFKNNKYPPAIFGGWEFSLKGDKKCLILYMK